MRISIPTSAARPPVVPATATNAGAARVTQPNPAQRGAAQQNIAQQNGDSGDSERSFDSAMRSARATLSDSGSKPGSNQNSKSGSAKQDSSDGEASGNSTPKPSPPKGASSAGASQDKPDSPPVIIAADPTPVPDQALMLKTELLKSGEAPGGQPHSNPEPPVPVASFALPEPATAPGSAAASGPATPPAEPSEGDMQAGAAPGNLVFQLSLDSAPPKGRVTSEEQQEDETAAFLSAEQAPANSQPQAGAAGSDAKSQDQSEQQPPSLPQVLPAGLEGTIASQFGFEAPLSFAVQAAATKVESSAAPAAPRVADNAATGDLPMASSIDRLGLTIRGAGDQVVRVEISQSGELVQVGVHTGNNDLASELRASVPELIDRLDRQGYESRLTTPSATLASLAQPVIAAAHSEFRSGADSNGNPKSNGEAAPQQEELRQQQRQRNPQRAWRELASQLQED